MYVGECIPFLKNSDLENNHGKKILKKIKLKKIIKILFNLMRPIFDIMKSQWSFRELKLQTYVHTYLG